MKCIASQRDFELCKFCKRTKSSRVIAPSFSLQKVWMQKATVTKVRRDTSHSSVSSAFQMLSIFFDCMWFFIFIPFSIRCVRSLSYIHTMPCNAMQSIVNILLSLTHKNQLPHFGFKIKASFHLSSNKNIWMGFRNENIWNKWLCDTTAICVSVHTAQRPKTNEWTQEILCESIFSSSCESASWHWSKSKSFSIHLYWNIFHGIYLCCTISTNNALRV